MSRNVKRGFTVLEFLIALAIIAILAATIISSFNSHRAKARDAKRLNDIQDFTSALQLYHLKFKKYPCGDATHVYTDPNPAFSNGTADSSFSDGFLDAALVPVTNCIGEPTGGVYTEGFYPTWWSRDPINDITYFYGYYYWVSRDRQKYIILNRLEQHAELMANDGGSCNNYYEAGPFTGQISLSLLSNIMVPPRPPCNI